MPHSACVVVAEAAILKVLRCRHNEHTGILHNYAQTQINQKVFFLPQKAQIMEHICSTDIPLFTLYTHIYGIHTARI